jgi:hypothetical protein
LGNPQPSLSPHSLDDTMEAPPQGPTVINSKLLHQEGMLAIRFEDGTHIPFRVLTYGEYRGLSSMLSSGTITQDQFEDEIWSRCILDDHFADKPKSLRAGIPTTVCKLIASISAPSTHEELIDAFKNYRERLQDIEEQMKMIIIATFPGYTLDKLDSCTFDTITRLFAGAEWLVVWKGGEQFDFTSKGNAQSGRISNKEIAAHQAAIRG